MSMINARNRRLRQIEETKAKIESIRNQYRGSNLPDYVQPTVNQLESELRGHYDTVRYIETSHGYQTELQMQAMTDQRAKDREIAARREARLQRIAQEQAAFDERMNAIHWDFVFVPDIQLRRAIVREHLAKKPEWEKTRTALTDETTMNSVLQDLALTNGYTEMQINAVRRQMREQANTGFETRYTDDESGRAYVVVTDADGLTFVDVDHSLDSDNAA